MHARLSLRPMPLASTLPSGFPVLLSASPFRVVPNPLTRRSVAVRFRDENRCPRWWARDSAQCPFDNLRRTNESMKTCRVTFHSLRLLVRTFPGKNLFRLFRRQLQKKLEENSKSRTSRTRAEASPDRPSEGAQNRRNNRARTLTNRAITPPINGKRSTGRV